MDLHAYRQALLAAARRRSPPDRHLAPQTALPDGALSPVTLNGEHLRLSVWLAAQGTVIAAVRFEAAADDASLLAAFCEAVEGLPLEEAAAYGADYTFLHLAREVPRPSQVGIAPVAILLPILAAAQELLRALRQDQRTQPGMAPIGRARFLTIPKAWQQLPAPDRLLRIRDAIAAFLDQQGLARDLVTADRLEDDTHHRPARLILTHAKADDGTTLPPLMRALERHLRTTVAPWVELYAEERVDRNALRRTILTDQRNP